MISSACELNQPRRKDSLFGLDISTLNLLNGASICSELSTNSNISVSSNAQSVQQRYPILPCWSEEASVYLIDLVLHNTPWDSICTYFNRSQDQCIQELNSSLSAFQKRGAHFWCDKLNDSLVNIFRETNDWNHIGLIFSFQFTLTDCKLQYHLLSTTHAKYRLNATYLSLFTLPGNPQASVTSSKVENASSATQSNNSQTKAIPENRVNTALHSAQEQYDVDAAMQTTPAPVQSVSNTDSPVLSAAFMERKQETKPVATDFAGTYSTSLSRQQNITVGHDIVHVPRATRDHSTKVTVVPQQTPQTAPMYQHDGALHLLSAVSAQKLAAPEQEQEQEQEQQKRDTVAAVSVTTSILKKPPQYQQAQHPVMPWAEKTKISCCVPAAADIYTPSTTSAQQPSLQPSPPPPSTPQQATPPVAIYKHDNSGYKNMLASRAANAKLAKQREARELLERDFAILDHNFVVENEVLPCLSHRLLTHISNTLPRNRPDGGVTFLDTAQLLLPHFTALGLQEFMWECNCLLAGGVENYIAAMNEPFVWTVDLKSKFKNALALFPVGRPCRNDILAAFMDKSYHCRAERVKQLLDDCGEQLKLQQREKFADDCIAHLMNWTRMLASQPPSQPPQSGSTTKKKKDPKVPQVAPPLSYSANGKVFRTVEAIQAEYELLTKETYWFQDEQLTLIAMMQDNCTWPAISGALNRQTWVCKLRWAKERRNLVAKQLASEKKRKSELAKEYAVLDGKQSEVTAGTSDHTSNDSHSESSSVSKKVSQKSPSKKSIRKPGKVHKATKQSVGKTRSTAIAAKRGVKIDNFPIPQHNLLTHALSLQQSTLLDLNKNQQGANNCNSSEDMVYTACSNDIETFNSTEYIALNTLNTTQRLQHNTIDSNNNTDNSNSSVDTITEELHSMSVAGDATTLTDSNAAMVDSSVESSVEASIDSSVESDHVTMESDHTADNTALKPRQMRRDSMDATQQPSNTVSSTLVTTTTNPASNNKSGVSDADPLDSTDPKWNSLENIRDIMFPTASSPAAVQSSSDSATAKGETAAETATVAAAAVKTTAAPTQRMTTRGARRNAITVAISGTPNTSTAITRSKSTPLKPVDSESTAIVSNSNNNNSTSNKDSSFVYMADYSSPCNTTEYMELSLTMSSEECKTIESIDMLCEDRPICICVGNCRSIEAVVLGDGSVLCGTCGGRGGRNRGARGEEYGDIHTSGSDCSEGSNIWTPDVRYERPSHHSTVELTKSTIR